MDNADHRLDILLVDVSVRYIYVRMGTDGIVVARYLVGLLHSRTPSFFEAHHPVSFSTIATPVSYLHNAIH
jgi:hypothetical protein